MGQLLVRASVMCAWLVIARRVIAIVAFVTLVAAPACDAQVSGSAPVNWGNDPSVVAWWPFDGDMNNHSTSTTYCNPTSAANLRLYFQGSTVWGVEQYDRVHKQQGTSSFLFNGNTTPAQMNPIGPDCLRTQQPKQWTYGFWLRVTANNAGACTPYPAPLFNREEHGDPPTPLAGVYITYISDGGAADGETYACTNVGLGVGHDVCAYPKGGTNKYFAPTSTWHYASLGYNGSALTYAIDGQAPGSVTTRLGKNPGNYPFQMSHDSNSTCGAGVIGTMDDVFWTDHVLTQSQTCRVAACGADGSNCWCDGTNPAQYRACTTNADCGGHGGLCNATAGRCVGNLMATCSVAGLPACNANLTGNVATTTTTSTTLPTGSAPSPPRLLSVDPNP
jgi:hypothetical protein